MENDFNPDNLTLGFIGLGLIGGSMAKAFRDKYKNCTIIAYNRSEKPRIMALNDGTANIVTDVIDETFSKCDFIFLCTPVQFNEHYLDILSKIIKPDCIISDVGSVKGNIHKAVESSELERNFIGGHPMAGSEKTGYEYSKASICNGAIYPVTPTKHTKKSDLAKYISLLEGIGFKPIIMTCNEHDYTTAAISHLPHLISAELALLVRDNEDDNLYMQKLAATGFKDTTRIASSSAEMWQQICMTNTENISDLLGDYIKRLQKLKTALDNKDGNAIYKLFEESKEYRDKF